MKKNCNYLFQIIRQRYSLKKKHNNNICRKRRRRKLKVNNEFAFLPVPRRYRRDFIQKKTVAHSKSVDKQECVKRYLPSNIKYLLEVKKSPFYYEDIKKNVQSTNGYIFVPKRFSIIDNPDESYDTLRKIIHALLLENIKELTLDYKYCESTELSTQVLLDIILQDYVKFKDICKRHCRNRKDIFPEFGGVNIDNKELKEMMWSVGSPATLGIAERNYNNVVKYKLRVHSIEKNSDEKHRMEQKELDTTELIDYVISCLKRMNKRLTPQKRDDLCTVIGEILINAEEHSTTSKRFSIGFFREYEENDNHFGLIRLVILNFGKTIYEKFKADDCPNQDIVKKMHELSDQYTRKSFFFKDRFEEENLWTLYALQEGVTSVPSSSYFKRGNGSIRFIESFFNIKGNSMQDDVSRMTIVSGRTKIVFDGSYNITNSVIGEEKFKVMAFNQSGSLEDKPDSTYVNCTKNYFPGTMISVKLLLNNDDIQEIY